MAMVATSKVIGAREWFQSGLQGQTYEYQLEEAIWSDLVPSDLGLILSWQKETRTLQQLLCGADHGTNAPPEASL